MATVNDNYPKHNTEISDAQLKELAIQQYNQQEVRQTKFPTEIIDLPSQGKLYAEGSALSTGKVEMKYMTAKEEDILSSSNLIKQGVVLDRLFQSLIVSPINYNDLLIGDKNAIMVAARVLGYGKEYEVEIEDPFSEGDKQKVTIDLTTIEPKEFDFSLMNPGSIEFELTLPASKRQVTCTLMTHGIDTKIREAIKGQLKVSKLTGVEKELTTRMKYLLTSVDDNTDRAYINNFVDNELFAQDSRYIRDEIKRRTPDMDMTFVFTSNQTGESQVMEVPMDVSFFWPKS